MGVAFKTVPTDDPVVRQLQENITSLANAIPTSSSPVVVSVSKDYQVTGQEDVVHVNSQSGPVTITLKSPSSKLRPVTIKQVNLQGSKTKVNPVTIVSSDGSKTIAGAASLALDDTGTGSVTLTSDNSQHWPTSGAGGNPPVPVPPPSGAAVFVPYIGIDPIKVVGNVISFTGVIPPPVPSVTPWIAPVPYGNQNTFISGTTGAESWVAECMVDFTGAAGNISAYFWLEAQDSGSSGLVRIRIGATAYKDITAPICSSQAVSSTTMSGYSNVITFPSPIGLQRVTMTLQSTNTNKLIATGVNLQFR